MIKENKKQEIADKLKNNGVKFICPMCGNNNFIIADGYFSNYIQDDIQNVSIGGQSIPSIPIVCSKCGFISQHSLGVLKLINN